MGTRCREAHRYGMAGALFDPAHGHRDSKTKTNSGSWCWELYSRRNWFTDKRIGIMKPDLVSTSERAATKPRRVRREDRHSTRASATDAAPSPGRHCPGFWDCLNHRMRSFAQQRVRRILQLVGGADRLQQLFLGRQQVRTIDLHQLIGIFFRNLSRIGLGDGLEQERRLDKR